MPRRRRPQQRPPLTYCAECGRTHRNWRPGALCPECVRKLAELPPLNLRELRKRLQAIPLTRPAADQSSDPPTAA